MKTEAEAAVLPAELCAEEKGPFVWETQHLRSPGGYQPRLLGPLALSPLNRPQFLLLCF